MEDNSTMETIQTKQYSDLVLTGRMSEVPVENTSIVKTGTMNTLASKVMNSVETLVRTGFVPESTEIPAVASSITEQVAIATERAINNPGIAQSELPIPAVTPAKVNSLQSDDSTMLLAIRTVFYSCNEMHPFIF